MMNKSLCDEVIIGNLRKENALLLARIKQLEIDRDNANVEKDKLFLDWTTVLLTYTKWLKDHEFVVTMNKPEALVTSFIKVVNKLKTIKL